LAILGAKIAAGEMLFFAKGQTAQMLGCASSLNGGLSKPTIAKKGNFPLHSAVLKW